MRINKMRYDLEGATLWRDGETIKVGASRLLTPADLLGAEVIR